MGKFDHFALPVKNWKASRDWWATVLGLSIEFEIEDQKFCALKDDNDFAIFLNQAATPAPAGFGIWYQVDDVAEFHRDRDASGIVFDHEPMKTPWGYGAQLSDPDGYKIYVWDEVSMQDLG